MSLTRELETIFFIIIMSVIFLVAMFYLREKQFHTPVITSLPSFITNKPTPTPTPTITSPLPKTTVTSWNSSDGVKKLTMKTTVTPKVSTTYAFILTDTTTNSDMTLFIQTIPGESNMSIPFNAFSPDNKYVFLKETINSVNHYLVFKTSGEVFRNGKIYLDITPLFSNYSSVYSLSDVTGWAAPTLLIANTKKSNGSQGPSFWFDVTTNGFIQLATLFK